MTSGSDSYTACQKFLFFLNRGMPVPKLQEESRDPPGGLFRGSHPPRDTPPSDFSAKHVFTSGVGQTEHMGKRSGAKHFNV